MERRRFIQMVTTGGAILTLPAHEMLAFAQNTAPSGLNPYFPVLICDDNDEIWAATEVREDLPGKIHIDNVVDGKLVRKCVIEVPGATGIAPPALAAWGGGCVVCFAVEKQDTWLIAYAFVDNSSSGWLTPQIIKSEGSANISPVVTVSGGKAHILWESNARGFRGIYHCSVNPTSASLPIRLSSTAANSYNPAICAMENGDLFAAWDSYRSQSSDIYGTRRVNGSWQEEKRFTSDPRIERHPRLAARNGEIWMTWQAQVFPTTRVNSFRENRIVVARVDGLSLLSPLSLFTEVSTNERNLLRPNIVFDSAGRLWLSAALGGERSQSKWHAVVFCYNGAQWTPLHKLHEESRGKWHPTPMAFSGRDGALSAVQFDNVPEAWIQRGLYPEWTSWVEFKPLPETNLPAVPFRTESLKMPSSNFSLKKYIQQQNLDMERQNWGALGLYWGTLHNHTDISVCVRKHDPPGHDLYANERDIEKADFCAITDHGYNFDKYHWQLNGEQTRNNQDPGRFVTFLGQEWTSDIWPKGAPKEERGYGHRNIIFLDPYFGEYFDAFDADINPSEIWERLRRDKVRCMFIPHQLADMGSNVPVDWDHADETYQPLAEIYQTRGSYEYLGCPRQANRSATFKGNYLQDAWARGIVVGVMASPDHGGGDGKVGVWAPELSRAGIFNALAARHTFGTSGPKMAIQFSSGRFMMGDKAPLESGPISFKIKAVAGTAIRQVVIFRNNVKVFEQTPGTSSLDINWKDTSPPEVKRLWYYARIETDDTHLAWSSPIWFIQG